MPPDSYSELLIHLRGLGKKDVAEPLTVFLWKSN
jgi:hypothetical protein